MRRYGTSLTCPICGIKHRKYPSTCAFYANIGYNTKTLERYDAETIYQFNEYCINKGFIRESSAPFLSEDYYDRIKRENKEREERENIKSFCNIDVELFKL